MRMNSKDKMQALLHVMADIVLSEVPFNDFISRKDLVERLGLKMNCYPTGSKTQGESTWLASILIRMLEDAGKIESHHFHMYKRC
jgi:hypothetical protein